MDEDGPLLAAQHFYWGACMVCHLTASPGKPLKRCSRCHAIYYCSAEHQKIHWKSHRALCNHLASAALAADQENFFSGAVGMSLKECSPDRTSAPR